MQLIKVYKISAGVVVVTKGRRRAFTPGDEVSSAEGSGLGKILVLGEYTGKIQVHIYPFCIWSALWKLCLAEAPAWRELCGEQVALSREPVTGLP